MTHFGKDRRGSVVLVFALALVPLILGAGTALDYSRATAARSTAQAALDAAVLAGVQQPAANQVDTARRAFQDAVATRLVSDPAPTFWVDNGGTLHGRATIQVPTSLLRVAQITTMPVGVTSAARAQANTQPVCILLLTPNNSGLTLNANALIDAPNCEVHVKSTASASMLLNTGAELKVKRACVAGQITLNNTPSKAAYQPNCETVSDPFAGKLPALPVDNSCMYANKTYDGGGSHQQVTLDPGVICNGMNVNMPGTLTFNPGVYRVRGGPINLNANVDAVASGVTFFFEDASSYIQMNASSTLTLSAPSTGPTAGIAMYEAAGLGPSNLTIAAASTGTLEGLFYLPSRAVTLNSTATVNARKLTLVANSMIVNTGAVLNVDAAPDATKRIYRSGAPVLVN